MKKKDHSKITIISKQELMGIWVGSNQDGTGSCNFPGTIIVAIPMLDN